MCLSVSTKIRKQELQICFAATILKSIIFRALSGMMTILKAKGILKTAPFGVAGETCKRYHYVELLELMMRRYSKAFSMDCTNTKTSLMRNFKAFCKNTNDFHTRCERIGAKNNLCLSQKIFRVQKRQLCKYIY